MPPQSPLAASAALLFLGALMPDTAGASIYRVGNDAACSHPTLAAAIAAAAANGAEIDEIRLPAGALAPLTTALVIDGHSLLLVGGFADCDAGTPSARTAVTGTLGVLRVQGDAAAPIDVTLRGLDLSAQDRRVLDLNGAATLRLEDTSVAGGRAGPQDDDQVGGGVRVTGADAALILSAGARIASNYALLGGGGVYCRLGHVQLELGSSIDTNVSEGNGGGLYLDACRLRDESGGAPRGGGGNFGITGNQALGNGGGIYAINGTTMEVVGTSDLTLIAGNTAANGAGLYVTGNGTNGVMVNSAVDGNLASGFGGGLFVRDRATLDMVRYTVDCPDAVFCSRLHDNSAAHGSALAADGAAQAKILQTDIRHNPVTTGAAGAAIDARGADSAFTPPTPTYVLLESVVLFDHAPAPAAYSAGGALLRAAFVSTLANGGAVSLGDGGRASLFSSVIQDNVFLLPVSGTTTRFADCLTVKEAVSIPEGFDGIEVLDNPAALYKSPLTGDLRQRPHARSIDRCDTFFYPPTTRDALGFLRGFDVPSVHYSPSFGTIDQGATEAQWLFADDFEQ